MTYEQERLNSLKQNPLAAVPWEVLTPEAFQDLLHRFSGKAKSSMPVPTHPVILLKMHAPKMERVWTTGELIGSHAVLHTVHNAEKGPELYLPLIFCGFDNKHREWMWWLHATAGEGGPSKFFVAVMGHKEINANRVPIAVKVPALMEARARADAIRSTNGIGTFGSREICTRCEKVFA